MAQLYVPYKGEAPAFMTINGHRLVLISKDKDELQANLDLFGADKLTTVDGGDSQEEQDHSLCRLAEKVEGGVVIAPPEVGLKDIIKNLEEQLPWVQ